MVKFKLMAQSDMKRDRRYIRWTFCIKKKQEEICHGSLCK